MTNVIGSSVHSRVSLSTLLRGHKEFPGITNQFFLQKLSSGYFESRFRPVKLNLIVLQENMEGTDVVSW